MEIQHSHSTQTTQHTLMFPGVSPMCQAAMDFHIPSNDTVKYGL